MQFPGLNAANNPKPPDRTKNPPVQNPTPTYGFVKMFVKMQAASESITI
jgi:hypothetical protein